MAIEIGTETLVVTRKDPSGAIISRDRNAAIITRPAWSVADEAFKAAGATVMGARMVPLIALAADPWRHENITTVAI